MKNICANSNKVFLKISLAITANKVCQGFAVAVCRL
jgi:hypothetical protein